jgi:hypothetical protein
MHGEALFLKRLRVKKHSFFLPKPTLPHSVVIKTVMLKTNPSGILHHANVLAQKVYVFLIFISTHGLITLFPTAQINPI